MTAEHIADADGHRTEAQEDVDDIRAAAAADVELLRRQRVLEDANTGYAALRDDPATWAHEQVERTVHEGTLADGLEQYSEEPRTCS